MSFNVINTFQTFYDSTGKVRSSGFVTFFENTTTTLAQIFSDEALTVAQTNPYQLDAHGRITGDVKFAGLLTLKITNEDLSDVRTDDDVTTLQKSEKKSDSLANSDLRYGPIFLTVAAMKQSNPVDINGVAVTLVEGMTVTTQGYFTAGDGGGATYLIVATQAFDGFGDHQLANLNIAVLQIDSSINSRHYGAKIDGVNDDFDSLEAHRAASVATGEATRVPAGTCKINTGLSLDLGLASFECDGTTFDCSGMTVGAVAATNDGAFNIFSSLAFPALKNAAHIARGFVLEGNAVSGVHGITFGHPTNNQAGELHIDDWAVRQFDRNLNYIDNAWRIDHGVGRNENPVNHFLFFPGSTLTNSGEVMKFDHVMFADGDQVIHIDGGQFDFYSCSILNAKLEVSGDSRVNLFGPNFENPGNLTAGYRIVRVIDPDSTVNIYGGRLVINDPTGGTTWDNVPFECASGVVGGLHFHGFAFPAGSAFFKPENDVAFGSNRLLVGGSGRVTMNAGVTFSGFVSNNDLVIAQGANVISNGDAELGAITGWTATSFGSGGPATFTATAGAKRNGTFGFDLDAVAATAGVEVVQDVPCEPGKYVVMNAAINLLAGNVSIFLRFRDSSGNNISSVALAIPAGSGFIIRDISGIAPSGTSAVRVEITGLVDAAISHAFVDDIIVNIV